MVLNVIALKAFFTAVYFKGQLLIYHMGETFWCTFKEKICWIFIKKCGYGS